MRVKVSFFIIGVLGVVLALVLLLTPVSAPILDAPCGSVLLPTKVHHLVDGELVFANTSSCREARMDRLFDGLWVGGAGLFVVVVSWPLGWRRD